MIVKKANFILKGPVSTYRRTSDNGQSIISHFCPVCGNPIYGELERFSDIVTVRPGTLNDTNWFNPEKHIWTNSAQGWFQFSEECEALPKGRW